MRLAGHVGRPRPLAARGSEHLAQHLGSLACDVRCEAPTCGSRDDALRRVDEDVRPQREECGCEPVRFHLGLWAVRYLLLTVQDEVSQFVGGVETSTVTCEKTREMTQSAAGQIDPGRADKHAKAPDGLVILVENPSTRSLLHAHRPGCQPNHPSGWKRFSEAATGPEAKPSEPVARGESTQALFHVDVPAVTAAVGDRSLGMSTRRVTGTPSASSATRTAPCVPAQRRSRPRAASCRSKCLRLCADMADLRAVRCKNPAPLTDRSE
jgi:hypothetical protein